jgi:hypothetical protein
MELTALLALLYSATDRSRTVRATVRRKHYQARELDLLRARGFYRDGPPVPREEGPWSEPPPVIEAATRLWVARPYRLRWESTLTGDGMDERTSVGVKDRELFWTRHADGEVHTNEGRNNESTMTIDEELLLDPAPLLGAYRFEIREPTTFLDRDAWLVTASPRLAANMHAFGPLSEELALVVDEEQGILLRVVAFAAGEEISHSEMLEVIFDEPVLPELFHPLR